MTNLNELRRFITYFSSSKDEEKQEEDPRRVTEIKLQSKTYILLLVYYIIYMQPNTFCNSFQFV